MGSRARLAQVTVEAADVDDKTDKSPQIRIAHVPRNIGGNTSGLSDGLRSLGFKSEMITFVRDTFGFSVVGTRQPRLTQELRRVLAIPRVLLTHDVMHYNAGTTIAMPALPQPFSVLRRRPLHFLTMELHSRLMGLVQLLELSAARLLRRTLVMTFQGDDARQGDVSLQIFNDSIAHHVDDSYYNVRSDREKRRRIIRFQRFGVKMLALNPDLLHVLPGSSQFIPYTNVDEARIDWGNSKTHDLEADVGGTRALRVVHAPSHRAAKGTVHVIAAVQALQREGHSIELILVENMINKLAREVIEGADVLIDQVHAGWYGGVAVEAMAAGVPVICFVREGDLRFIPEGMRRDLPVIRTTSASLRESLVAYLALSDQEKHRLSIESRTYVWRWHNPRLIASQVAELYGRNLHGGTRSGKVSA